MWFIRKLLKTKVETNTRGAMNNKTPGVSV